MLTQQPCAGVTDNAAVTFQAGRRPSEGLAMTESRNGTIRIARADLDTIARVPMADAPSIAAALQTAHPKRLPSGETLNVYPDVPTSKIQVRRRASTGFGPAASARQHGCLHTRLHAPPHGHGS